MYINKPIIKWKKGVPKAAPPSNNTENKDRIQKTVKVQ